MNMIFFLILLIIAISLDNTLSIDLNVKAWKSLNDNPDINDYPESELLSNKPSTAIAFSGGGACAFNTAMTF